VTTSLVVISDEPIESSDSVIDVISYFLLRLCEPLFVEFLFEFACLPDSFAELLAAAAARGAAFLRA
jgi:hypothetical protein